MIWDQGWDVEQGSCRVDNHGEENNLNTIVKDLQVKYDEMTHNMKGEQSVVNAWLQSMDRPTVTNQMMNFSLP